MTDPNPTPQIEHMILNRDSRGLYVRINSQLLEEGKHYRWPPGEELPEIIATGSSDWDLLHGKIQMGDLLQIGSTFEDRRNWISTGERWLPHEGGIVAAIAAIPEVEAVLLDDPNVYHAVQPKTHTQTVRGYFMPARPVRVIVTVGRKMGLVGRNALSLELNVFVRYLFGAEASVLVRTTGPTGDHLEAVWRLGGL